MAHIPYWDCGDKDMQTAPDYGPGPLQEETLSGMSSTVWGWFMPRDVRCLLALSD